MNETNSQFSQNEVWEKEGEKSWPSCNCAIIFLDIWEQQAVNKHKSFILISHLCTLWENVIHDVGATDKGMSGHVGIWRSTQTPSISALSYNLQLLILNSDAQVCARDAPSIRRNELSSMTAGVRKTVHECKAVRPACASLNPVCCALCWNSHRLSKQSNSGSICPSIGGIETELVVARGQEILTRALSRLPAAGWRTYTHILTHSFTDTHTFTAKVKMRQIFENTCIQIYER